MDTRPIGIFDSGVGGLSVFREIKIFLPKENYIFIADQKNVPYGGKSKYQLCKISDRIVKYFIKRNVKMVIIACNTASCYAIDFLRKKYPSLLLVGTIPAIKTAAELSRRKSIAVLSTPATAKSSYVRELIRKYATGVTVVNIGVMVQYLGTTPLLEYEDVHNIQSFASDTHGSGASCARTGLERQRRCPPFRLHP